MTLHAPLKQREDVAIVGISSKGKSSAVVHKLLELGRLVQAELIDGHLLFFALDVIIFLILRAAWQTLPGQGAAEEVQKNVPDGLEVIPSALLVAQVRGD